MPDSHPPHANLARIAYLELQVGDAGESRTFFEAAFGWTLTSFGPDYAATLGAGTDLGLDASGVDAGKPPLAGIEVVDLEAALAAVEKAGGRISRPIFAFPGGRRFHFREPGGNELAVFVNEPDAA
ncbi:VOC family protein [Aquisediminimonas sediminicola]|uniref:VOC family protein n=1 Tax=Alteraquisediminimonas sediminicola TaxID=2676787 RepID=UPI001FE45483|nr:VOC family protein [Aquisediminimonas sediminicola]